VNRQKFSIVVLEGNRRYNVLRNKQRFKLAAKAHCSVAPGARARTQGPKLWPATSASEDGRKTKLHKKKQRHFEIALDKELPSAARSVYKSAFEEMRIRHTFVGKLSQCFETKRTGKRLKFIFIDQLRYVFELS